MDIMEDEEPFKLEANLQEFSTVAAAIKFWESPIIRKKIRQCFRNKSLFKNNLTSFSNFQDLRKSFNEVLEQILQHLNALRLPEKVIDKIREAVIFTGKEIFYWIHHVISDLELEFQYAEKMYWTNHGTIDESKTFQLYWQNDSNLLGLCEKKQSSDSLPILYNIACINCQEKFVSNNLNHMREILKNYCDPLITIPEDVSVHSLIIIWICCYVKKSKEEGCQFYKSLSQSNDLESKLFGMCASAGFVNGVKYFTNYLKNGKDRHFYRCAEMTLREIHHSGMIYIKAARPNDRRDNFTELLIFLINGMSPTTRSFYLTKYLKDLFDILIHIWPHYKLFLQILNYSLPSMTNEDHEKLLSSVFSYFRDEHHCRGKHLRTCLTSCNTTRKIARTVLGLILEQTSEELKKTMIIDNGGSFLKNLICLGDFPTIEVVFTDSYAMNHRHYIINSKIVEVFRQDFTEKELTCLTEFTQELLSDDERNEFKINFNICEDILQEGKFDLFIKLIDWKANSEEEKLILKKRINAFHVFDLASLHKRQAYFLPIANKLLNYQFDGDEEQIRLFKRGIHSEKKLTEEYFQRHFYTIWSQNCIPTEKKSKNLCSQFLNLFFEEEETEIFKREKIIGDENFLKMFCKFLVLIPEKFDTVDELLQFCGISSEEKEEMKRKILDDIESWIAYFGIEKHQFIIANALLNWIVQEEEQKKEVIGKFMNSTRNLDLCCEVLGNRSTFNTSYDFLLTFLNLWVKPHINTSEMFLEMSNRWKGAEHSERLTRAKKLFEKLEENGCLVDDDVKNIMPPLLMRDPRSTGLYISGTYPIPDITINRSIIRR